MKLEVLDLLDTWKELRVATVLKILDDGFLKVRIKHSSEVFRQWNRVLAYKIVYGLFGMPQLYQPIQLLSLIYIIDWF